MSIKFIYRIDEANSEYYEILRNLVKNGEAE